MLYFLARNCSFTPPDPRDARYGFIYDAPGAGALPAEAHSCQMDLDVFLRARPPAAAGPRLWVHCPARPFSGRELADALAAWPGEVVPVSGDKRLIEELLSAGVRHIALKGNESSGWVSRESLGVLFSMFEGRGAKISVWGGIALPEAAAAFFATGAESIVFESVHALCGEPAPDLAERLRGLRIADFREVGRGLDPEGRFSGLCLRVFDRGNNSAVQALRRRETEIARTEPEKRMDLLAESAGPRAVRLTRSALAKDELVFLGPEAAFARHFCERFGSDPQEALAAFTEAVFVAWRAAPQKIAAAFDPQRVAGLTGGSLPFIQGAMTWITDKPALARTIAASGALPTLALGPRSISELQAHFGPLGEVMGGSPFALNVLVLSENPCREEQLDWIERIRPPFVTLAAGDPAFTRRLSGKGLRVLCHVQDESWLSLALEAGAWGVILEGNEAGGHVGEQTALTLTQMAWRWRQENPRGRRLRVVLAGGIAKREAVARALLLGADLVQMGTAYLATHEFTTSGALSALYQERLLAGGDTCLSGQGVGLRVRSLVSPRTRAILELEREFEQQALPLAERRRRLEALSAGSLLLAARGLDRTGRTRDAETCLESGQFMSGSIAGLLNAVQPLAAWQASLVCDPQSLRPAPAAAFSAPARPAPAARARVGITGLAIATPLGNDPETLWQNAAAGRSGIVALKLRADDPPDFLNPEFQAGKRSYCGVSGELFLDIRRQDIRMPPHEFRDLSYSTRLTLWLAERAVADARLLEAGYAPERIGVFVSQNSGEQASSSWDVNLCLRVDWLLKLVSEEANPSAEQVARLRTRLLEGRAGAGAGSMLGRLNCTAAGFICRRFGFSGPSHSTGAACAAGMAALFDAWTLIQAGVIDAAVVGGGEEDYTPLPYAEFCAMGALARSAEYDAPSRCSRPFDARRTGFVPSGGGAIVVLEREEAAAVRGAPCWGLLTGMGAATNAEGLVEPSAAVQIQAIRGSFRDLEDYGPRDVDLIECHATSTPGGDLEEGRALVAVFGPEGGATLCAFKSQIGHSFGASGLIALAHGLCAMREKALPPTLNHEHPDPQIGLAEAGLDLPSAVQAWREPPGGVRRLQVNAFGFGGACYVAQVEAPNGRRAALRHPGIPAGPARPVEEVLDLDRVRFTALRLAGSRYRAGLAQPEHRSELEALTAPPDLHQAKALAKRGIFLDAAADTPPLAFICCGQGSVYPGMGRELYDSFPLVRAGMERIAQAADWDMLALLDETDREKIVSTRWQQPYLLMLEYGIAYYLQALGLNPKLICGHSLGELIGLCLAGVYTPETACYLINFRGKTMQALEASSKNGMGMLSVSAGAEAIEEILGRHPSLSVCNYNSPRQFVLGGDAETLDALGRELRQRRVPAARLAVSMAFHHKGMRAVRPQSREGLLALGFSAPRVPILSNVTTEPYPGEPAAIREHILDLDENPVQFTRCVERLWNGYGVRHFVEIGPGAVLCGLVEDIRPEATTIPTCRRKKEAEALRATVARLYALGHLRMDTLRTLKPAGIPVSSPAPGRARPAQTPAAGAAGERTEQILTAIMKATGYERHELDLQMDLRADLGIRSIHFPVLLQELENQLGRKIGFEQLVGVATIEELAAVLEAAAPESPKGEASEEKPPQPVLRYGFDLAPVAATSAPPARPSGPLLLVGPGETARRLERYLGAHGPLDVEIRTPAEALAAAPAAAHKAGRSCLFALDPEPPARDPMDAVAGFTTLLKAHLAQSSANPFLLFGQQGKGLPRARAASVQAVFQAMTAVLLTAAQEHPKGRFRSVWLQEGLDDAPGAAALLLDSLFSPEGPLARVIGKEGTAATDRLRPLGLDPCGKGLPLEREDVILVSGGGGGIAPYLFSGLAWLKPRLILLGRSRPEAVAAALENEAWTALRREGAVVEYRSCDIRDLKAVQGVCTDLAARCGRIDGFVHAAGVSDEGPLAALSAEKLLEVLAVKCGGLENLIACSQDLGLRWAAALSSLAGWFGSFGQAAYAAANRAMACLMEEVAVPARVLWLPPVAGTGMAANESARAAMRLKGMDAAWVHCRELGGLIARELLQGQERQVLLSRYLPSSPGRAETPVAEAGPPGTPFYPVRPQAGSATPVRLEALPLPVCECRIEFSGTRDLWIADHRPWPQLEHPLLSAVMELECLLDGAQHLTPWHRPTEVFDASWHAPVACPEGISREGRIRVRAAETPGVSNAALEIRDVTDSWRRRRTWSEVARACLRMGPAAPPLSALWAEKSASDENPDLALADMQSFYNEKTAFGRRYRVLGRLEAWTGSRGRAGLVYPSGPDSTLPERRMAYPVYLLEAALQLTAIVSGRRGLPVVLKTLRWARDCAAGEKIEVEVRIFKNEARLAVADAQCRDAAGALLMTARGVTLAAPSET